MNNGAKSYRLGVIIAAAVLVPFWGSIMWLSGFWAWCESLWAQLASLPYREFFSQPLSQNDLMIAIPWMLLVVCAIRHFSQPHRQ